MLPQCRKHRFSRLALSVCAIRYAGEVVMSKATGAPTAALAWDPGISAAISLEVGAGDTAEYALLIAQ